MASLTISSATPTTIISPHLLGLPEEIWKEHIFFFANRNESLKNGLVCRDWRVLTIPAWRKSNRHDLKRLIYYLKNQIPFDSFALELKKIYQFFCETHDDSLKTPEQIDSSYWRAAGKTLAVFKKLTPLLRRKIEAAIRHQIPSSLNHFFVLADPTLVDAIQIRHFEAFSIVHSSCSPLTNTDHVRALSEAAKIGNILMLRVLVANRYEELVAAKQAWKSNQLACVMWLLTTGKTLRYSMAYEGILNKNVELVRFLQDKGSISDVEQSVLVETSIEKDLPEFIPLLLAHSPIESGTAVQCIQKAIDVKKPAFIPLLLDCVPMSETDALLETALKSNRTKVARAILDVLSNPDPERTAFAKLAFKEH